ncbi:MAG: hypothetical protein HYX60_03595, partial [Legionella longbeachae]|nr:hypothetical protein [Legionella longbeachae]
DIQFSHQRHIEKNISKYRKKLTKLFLINTFLNKFFDKVLDGKTTFSDIESKFNLNQCKDQDYFSNDDKLVYLKIQNEMLSLLANPNKVKDPLAISSKLLSFLNDGGLTILQSNEIFDLNKKEEKINFFEAMEYIDCFFDESDNKQLERKRIQIFFLGILKALSKILNIEHSSITNIKDLLILVSKLSALEDLTNKLALKKPDLNYFERCLMTGVYNELTLQIAKKTAKELHELFKNNWMNGFDNITDPEKSLIGFNSIYSFWHNYAYTQFISLYNLRYSSWTPKKGFDALVKAISEEGALVMNGKGIGLPFYKSPPEVLQNEKNKPIHIASRTIRFWQEKLPDLNEKTQGHSIVILGAQSIENDGNMEEYIYFIDPNDKSEPHQDSFVYRMSYEDLVSRILTTDSIKFSQTIDEGSYAIYSPATRF